MFSICFELSSNAFIFKETVCATEFPALGIFTPIYDGVLILFNSTLSDNSH